MILSVFGYLLLAVLAYLFYKRFVKMCYLRWLYGSRGVPFMSTIPRPFIGDMAELVRRIMAEPDRPPLNKLFWEHFGDACPPAVGWFRPHNMELAICDPDYAQDIFMTYNQIADKGTHVGNLMGPVMGNGILTMFTR